MTRNLGPIYRVPVAEDWEVYEFPEGDARAGILTQVSFLALHARSARSSPVLRGEFVLDADPLQQDPAATAGRELRHAHAR